MRSITSHPGARRLFAISIVARLPLTMLSIGLLVHVQGLTGSFAVAGLVTGVYAVALGAGGPLLGRIVDRRGQTAVLLATAGAAAALLVAFALLPASAPVPVLVGLAAGVGLSVPPLAACLRTLLPGLIGDPAELRAAYAVEALAVELTWVSGPALALGIAAVWSSGAMLVAAAAVLGLATAAFAAQPASRAWRPVADAPRVAGGSLRTPAMRTLVLVVLAAGTLFGAVEVAVPATAEALASTTAAAPLMTLWGAGSVAGGLLAVRLGGGADTAKGLVFILAGLTLGHLALAPAAGSLLAVGAVLLLAGAAIAPTFASVYAMAERAAPAGTATEAFAWLATAVAVGTALGSAAGGLAVDHAGAQAAFVLAGAAGAVAVLTATLCARTLATGQPPVTAAAAFA